MAKKNTDYLEAAKKAREEAAQRYESGQEIRTEAKIKNTWGNTGSKNAGASTSSKVKIENRTKTDVAKLTQQKKKEDASAFKVLSETEKKSNTAKKALEDYLASDEKKALKKKQMDDQMAKAMLFGVTDAQMEQEVDRKEEQLKKEADYWEAQVKKEREAKTMERDIKAVESWDDADKEELERYIQNRQSAFVQSLNPAATGLPAQYEDSYLIQKYGRQRLDEIASSYQRQKNAEKIAAQEQRGRDAVNANGFSAAGANVASVGANLADTLLNPLERIANMAGGKDVRYSTLDPNAGGQAAAYASGVRQQSAENIAGSEEGVQLSDGLNKREALALAYQGGMGFLDTAARSAVGMSPTVGAGLAAMGSFNQTLADASAKGATPVEAVAMATASAGIEALTEKIPLDELFKVANSGSKSFGKVLLNVMKQMGIEVLEEEASLIATTLAEAAILRGKSSYNQQIMGAVLAGIPFEQAKAMADNAILEEAKQTAIVSAVSGFMGAAGAEYNAYRYVGNVDNQQEQNVAPQVTEAVQEQQEEVPTPDAELTDIDNLLEGLRQEQADQQEAADSEWMRQMFEDAIANKNAEETEAQRKKTAQESDIARQNEKDRQKVAYESLQEEIRKQKDLEKTIAKSEQKLAETGKGSQARIDQLKTDLERQKDIVSQKQKFLNYREGNYDTNLESAIKTQQDLYENARMQVTLAIADYNDGRISAAQLQDAKNTYNNAGKELYRLKNMTPEQYRMELASIGLVGDLTTKQKPTESNWMEQSFRQEQPVQTEQITVQQEQQETKRAATPQAKTVNTKEQSVPQTSTQRMDTFEQSTEGGQIKGTGAAEANFSAKPAYNATLAEDNAQPDRRTDVRPMELPRQDVNGGNISAVTGNVYGSQNTPDDLASAMEEPTARGDFSYVPISNNEATQRAQKTIESQGGWNEARVNFRSDVEKGNAGAELSARGALILNHYGQAYEQAKASGDEAAAKKAKQEWLSVLADVRKLGTNTAQGLQAMRIIRNLMPEDKLEFAKAAVRNMVRDMRLGVDIQIDENLLTEYENAATDEQRDEIIGKIQKNVADQIPSTTLDKWNALRYTNMLGNLKTATRNTVGNVANNLVYRAKDTTAAMIETAANWLSKGKVGRTKSVIVNKNLQNACNTYYDQVKSAVSSGGKYSDNVASDDFKQGVMDKRKIFNFAPMEAYRKGTNWMMNNKYFGDEAFGKAAFTRSMAGYLQANGVKPGTDLSTVDSALIDKAMAHAVKEAQEATFHDNSALAKIFGNVKKSTGVVGEAIMPFTKTPANVLTRAEEFSPIGIINTAVMAAKKAAGNTEISGTDIINSLSKNLTGSMICALGAAMFGQGILNGGPDKDDEKAAFDKQNGIQDYSINLPDGTTYTLDWLTPVAMPLFMGAQLMKIAQERDNLTFSDLEQVFTSIADPMLQMSMVSGINDSLENIKYTDNNIGQFFINAAVSYLSQGLTNTLVGQMEKSTEQTRTTTYIDKDSSMPQWMQKQLGKASQKMPGWDFQQTDYINARGEKEEQRTDAGGWIYNLVSPGYLKKKQVDEVSEELYRLNKAGVEGNVFPESPGTTLTYTDKNGTVHKDYNLTPEQAETLKRETGTETMRIVEDIIKSNDYETMTDAQKAKAIQEAGQLAREKAEIAAIDDHTGLTESWMMKAEEGKEADYIIRRVTKSDLTNAMEALNTAWEKGYDTASRSDDLEWAYKTFEEMSTEGKKEVKEWATGTAAKYIEAREKGISHDDFLSAAKNVERVKGTGANGTVRDIDRREAIAKTTGLSAKEIDTVMKAYMEDYDPDAESPKTTELKYDYIRHVMGLTPAQYAETYRARLDNSKKKDQIAAMVALGYDKKVATKLYNIYAGNKKGKAAYMGYYNSK